MINKFCPLWDSNPRPPAFGIFLIFLFYYTYLIWAANILHAIYHNILVYYRLITISLTFLSGMSEVFLVSIITKLFNTFCTLFIKDFMLKIFGLIYFGTWALQKAVWFHSALTRLLLSVLLEISMVKQN